MGILVLDRYFKQKSEFLFDSNSCMLFAHDGQQWFLECDPSKYIFVI